MKATVEDRNPHEVTATKLNLDVYGCQKAISC